MTSAKTTIEANGITINYRLQDPSAPATSIPSPSFSHSQAPDLVVLINGLADDLTTWSAQVPALQAAGYRVLSYDNRGVGGTSRPPGPYSAELLATDLHALLEALSARGDVDARRGWHLVGVSMGGMIAQMYALMFPNSRSGETGENGLVTERGGSGRMLSLSLCCTYAQPTRFCSRMFAYWADVAVKMSVQDVMRDVTLWAFTVPFFRTREAELREVEAAMEALDMGVEEYLAQLAVIQGFDVTARLEALKAEGRVLGGLGAEQVLVLAGEEDILIPVVLSKELQGRVKGSRWATTKGGHGCMVSPCIESLHLVLSIVPLILAEADIAISGSFRTSSTKLSSLFWTISKGNNRRSEDLKVVNAVLC